MGNKVIKIGVLALAILLLAGALLYFIPYSEKVFFSLQGTAYKTASDETCPCTITFDGHRQSYLFKRSRLQGTFTVESDFRTYTVSIKDNANITGSGFIYSVPFDAPKVNLNSIYFSRVDAKHDDVFMHQFAFTDDMKTVYVMDNGNDRYIYDECFYLASSLPAEQAQEIYDQLLAFYHN